MAIASFGKHRGVFGHDRQTPEVERQGMETEANTHPWKDRTRVDRSGTHAQAERLMAEYLRKWGLRDPATIATYCHRGIRRAGTHPSRAALYRAVIEGAMNDMNAFVDCLTSPSAAEGDVEARRGLLAIELQGIIDKHPEFMLTQEPLPQAFSQRCQQAARPVVPAARPMGMPAQPLGELLPLVRPSWWKYQLAKVITAFAGLMTLRWSR